MILNTGYLALSLRVALRRLARTPAYTAALVSILGLIFGPMVMLVASVGNATRDSAGLFRASSMYVVTTNVSRTMSYLDFADIRSAISTRGIDLALYGIRLQQLHSEFGNVSTRVARVSNNYLSAVGASLYRGQAFAAPDRELDECIVSYRFWRDHLASTSDVVGLPVKISGREYRISGIASPGFSGITPTEQIDVWIPLDTIELPGGNPSAVQMRDARIYTAIAPLRTATSRSALDLVLTTMSGKLADRWPATNSGVDFKMQLMADLPENRALRRTAATAGAALALVLLVTLLDLTALGTARALSRRGEMAIQLALGGSQTQIVAPIVYETLLVSASGGILALILVVLITPSMAAVAPAMGGMLALSVRTVIEAMAIAAVLGVTAGTSVARRATRGLLAQAARAHGSGARSGAADLLIASEFAAAAGAWTVGFLLALGLRANTSQNPGYPTQGLLSVAADFRGVARGGLAGQAALFDQVLGGIRSLSGIEAAAIGSSELLNGWAPLHWPISSADAGGRRVDAAEFDEVSPGFFSTLGLRLVAGRGFRRSDFTGGNPQNVVVSQTLAEQLWHGQSAIGRRVLIKDRMKAVVVGVVQDARITDIRTPPSARFYFSIFDYPNPTFVLYVRTHVAPSAIQESIARTLAAAGDERYGPIVVRRVQDVESSALRPFKTIAEAASLIAVLSMLVAGIGLFGGVSHDFALQRRHVAIRLALGARPTRLCAQLLRRYLMLAGLGAAIGCIAATIGLETVSGTVVDLPSLGWKLSASVIVMTAALILVAVWRPLRNLATMPLASALRLN